jgi:hypothetical protein
MEDIAVVPDLLLQRSDTLTLSLRDHVQRLLHVLEAVDGRGEVRGGLVETIVFLPESIDLLG